MSMSITVKKAKASKLKRVSLLPRIGIYIDFAGKEISFRQAPILETLLNMKLKRRSLFDIVNQQLKEIALVDVKIEGVKLRKR